MKRLGNLSQHFVLINTIPNRESSSSRHTPVEIAETLCIGEESTVAAPGSEGGYFILKFAKAVDRYPSHDKPVDKIMGESVPHAASVVRPPVVVRLRPRG